MSSFIARIGLGCGRLRGGAEESNSRQVLDAALGCGIRYFDTAPSYGSESVLGRGLRGVGGDIQLCTKVGLAAAPDAGATLRGTVLAGLRRTFPDAVLDVLKKLPRAAARGGGLRGYGSFDAGSIRSSVQQSLNRLQTSRLHGLLLHEPRMSDPTPQVAQILQRLVVEGVTARLGVGTGHQLDELPAFGAIAQFAIGPALLGTTDARFLICHGLLRGLDRAAVARCMAKAGIYARNAALGKLASEPLGASALLLNAVLMGTNVGRVLVSTSSAARLGKFMTSAQNVYEEIRSGGDEMRGAFNGALREYYGP